MASVCPPKRRKLNAEDAIQPTDSDSIRWRTESEQRIYSSKLFQALRHINTNNNSSSSSATVNTVRETADTVLAARSRGKTRWSRAIVTNRLSVRLNQINRKHKKATLNKAIIGDVSRDSRLRKQSEKMKMKTKKKTVPVLEEKVSVLGRLVPGCNNLSFPNLLDETTDYIAALEMQVRAMTVLTQLLAGASPPPPP